MTVGKNTLAKKGEPKVLSWAAFPDGDLIEYFQCKKINDGGYWDWREDLIEVPEISQVWLTSSHFVRNESIVNLSVSLLVSVTRNDKQMIDLPKRIFEALENQGPTRNPTFNRKHSVLINSIIAKRVLKLSTSNAKWLTKNVFTFRIPIMNFEYNVKNNTEEELLQIQITNYFNALKERTKNQNRRTLFEMYSLEWINWILFAVTINAIFEQIYYNKLYKTLEKLPKEMAENLINNSPGCLNMLIEMWRHFWFKELHFKLIIRQFIDENCGTDYFQDYQEIIRSYEMLGYMPVKTDSDPEFCATGPSKNEINNFLIYHVQKLPKPSRNYALEQFITSICAMTFFNENQTVQEIESTFGEKVCKKCSENKKQLIRKMQIKTADKKRRQKRQEKMKELPELIKKNEYLLKEERTLNEEIKKAKNELQIINSACSNLN